MIRGRAAAPSACCATFDLNHHFSDESCSIHHEQKKLLEGEIGRT